MNNYNNSNNTTNHNINDDDDDKHYDHDYETKLIQSKNNQLENCTVF